MWKHLTTIALLTAEAITVLSTSTPSTHSFPNPNIDPFYNVPSNIHTFRPGQIVRNRPVITTVTGNAVESYQFLYRTNNQQNKATATVGTVWVPFRPASPPRIFSLQVPEDSVNIDCAPSWAWANASSTIEGYLTGDNPILIEWALKQGYYVVTADFEGVDAAWLVGHVEGRGVLDGVRGVINFLDLHGAEVALYGYSGGAHASSWASTLAAAYAAELEIVGAAFGGTPVDLRRAVGVLDGSESSYLAVAALAGLGNGYPHFNSALSELLNSDGVETMEKLRKPNGCVTSLLDEYKDVNLTSLFKDGRDPLSNPAVSDVFDQESLLDNVNPSCVPVPKFPRFEWHGGKDTIVPYEPEAEYIKQQCERGGDIRFLTLPDLDHGPNYLAGIPGSLLFIRQAFERKLEKVLCGQNVTVPAIGSKEAIDVVGLVYDSALQALFAAA